MMRYNAPEFLTSFLLSSQPSLSSGMLYSLFTLSDVVMLLCLVPVAVSYLNYQGSLTDTPIPLRWVIIMLSNQPTISDSQYVKLH